MNFNIQDYYAERYESEDIDANLILYEVRDGDSITDSPFAIFLQLATSKKYRNLKHIWVLKDLNSVAQKNIPNELLEKVVFVERNSMDYVTYMLKAKYLITNATFQSWFSKRKGQVYINTWHGTPLKFMGFDIPGNPAHSQNVVRNLLMTDFLITPNAHTTQVFTESYRLRGLYPGKILEAGYPRIDFTFNTDKKELGDKIITDGLSFDPNLPTILYMPTWRGKSITNPTNNIKQTIAEIEKIKKHFDGRYNVLLKVHPYIFKKTKEEKNIQSILIDDYYDANRILALTDILITDFSSVFFDYLVTNKPILFYSWDSDVYEDERGMYFDMKDLPGPQLFTIDDVLQAIENIHEIESNYYEIYQKIKTKIVPYDDGKVSKRIVDQIFSDQRLVKVLDVNDKKKKLLFCPGGLLNNGITSSFINLLKNINYHEYDVTVFMQTPKGEMLNNVEKLPKTVRMIFKPGVPIFTEKEKVENENVPDTEPIVAFERESRRLFSGINYDIAVDFSGYSHYWGKFLAYSTAKTKIIYQHNDLFSEINKEVSGRKPHVENLPKLFSIYHKFDKVVSVSKELMTLNYNNLSDYITKNQCAYARNVLDIKKILNQEETSITFQKPKILKKNLEFQLLPGEQTYYKNTAEILLGKSETILIADSKNIYAEAVAQFRNEDLDYYKLIVDHIYLGWFPANCLAAVTSEFIVNHEKNVDYVVSYKKSNKGYLIYSDLEIFTPRAFGRILKGYYLSVVKEVKTNKGNFSLISLDNEEIGWLRSKALGSIHRISRFSPLHLYFTFKNKIKDTLKLTDQINFTVLQLMLKKSSFTVYSEPQGVTGSHVKIENYYPQVFNIYGSEKSAVIEGQNWYLLNENKTELGWVSEKVITQKREVGQIDHGLRDRLLMAYIKEKTSESKHNYVTMGRLSPEKNQIELIKGFKKVLEKFPDANLFIFGEGPLKLSITEIVEKNQLLDHVHLLGHIESPFKYLSLMDVFVLPSLYEGQPMVLLETMTLGLKIVASGIIQNRAVLGDNYYGLLSNGTDEIALSDVMISIFDENLSFERFDYKAYNNQALQEFYQIIGDKVSRPIRNRVAIIGSCVSRLAFRSDFVPQAKPYYEVVNYQFHTSLISLMSKKIPFDTARFVGKDDNYAKEHLYSEFKKDGLNDLIASNPHILIIDFYPDVHFGVMKINNSYMTNKSWRYKRIQVFNDFKVQKQISPLSDFNEYVQIWKKNLVLFLDFMKDELPSTKIMITSARFTTAYQKEHEIKTLVSKHDLTLENQIWEKLDQIAHEEFGLEFLDMKTKQYLVDENHIHKLDPLHFEKKYYDDFIKILDGKTDLVYLRHQDIKPENVAIFDYDQKLSNPIEIHSFKGDIETFELSFEFNSSGDSQVEGEVAVRTYAHKLDSDFISEEVFILPMNTEISCKRISCHFRVQPIARYIRIVVNVANKFELKNLSLMKSPSDK